MDARLKEQESRQRPRGVGELIKDLGLMFRQSRRPIPPVPMKRAVKTSSPGALNP